MAQGKAFDKEDVIESLEEYFRLGYNRTQACKFVDIDNSTLSKWEKDDPTLSTKIEGWINSVNVSARKNIAAKIHNGDTDQSRWWIEKTDKDFNQKQEHEVTGGIDIRIVEEVKHHGSTGTD